MRKNQLENLELGAKVVNYNKKDTVLTFIGIDLNEDKKTYLLQETVTDRAPKTILASESTLLKNYKLIEDTEVAITTPESDEIVFDIVGFLSDIKTEDEELAEDLGISVEQVNTLSDNMARRNISLEDQVKAVTDSRTKKNKKPNIAQVISEDLKYITVKEMAEGLGMSAPDARRILRKAAYQKPEQGWKFLPNSEEYNSVLNTLKGIQEKRKDRA